MRDELIAAVQAGDTARVRTLLATDPRLAETRDDNGVSALMLSRYHAAPDELTSALREAREDVDIFEAATLGEAVRVEQWLNDDQDLLNERSPDGATALHFAAFFAQPVTARLLVHRGASVRAVSSTFGNVTPLHSAAAGGSAEIVRALLVAGADPNSRQDGGFAPLHAAAQNGDTQMARDLLEHGADPKLETDAGLTPLEIAVEQGHDEVAALLRQAAAASFPST